MHKMFALRALFLIVVLLQAVAVYGQPPTPEATTPEATTPARNTTASGQTVLPSQWAATRSVLPATPDLTYKTYLPETFSIYNSNTQFGFELGGRYVTAGLGAFGRQLELPQGAQLHEVTIYFVDNASGDIAFALYEQSPISSVRLLGAASSAGLSGASIMGLTISGISGRPIATIDNAQFAYIVEMNLPSYTSNHRIHGIRVGYKLGGAFLPMILRRE